MPSDRGQVVVVSTVTELVLANGDLGILVAADRDVDVGNVKVEGGDDLDTGDLRNLGKGLGGVPSVVGERGQPGQVSGCTDTEDRELTRDPCLGPCWR